MKNKSKKRTKSGLISKRPNLKVVAVAVVFGLIGLVAIFNASAALPVSTSNIPAVRALGVYPGFGATNGLSKHESIESYLGRKVLTASAYTEASSWSGFNSANFGNFENPKSLFVQRKDVRPALAVALNTNEVGGLTEKPGGPAIIRAGLLDVANGKYDDNYKKLADKLIKSGQKRAILRLGSEFDIGWTPWSVRNGNEDAFIAAFRHVAKLMKATPGNEFLIDYMGNGSFSLPYTTRTGVATTYAEAAYPGSDVVDIIGVDVYNRRDWDYVKTKLDYTLSMAKKYGKSMSIPEWGLWYSDTGDDPTYIQNMYDWMNKTPAAGPGRLEYHTYFWGNKEANLDQAPKSKSKFKELFGISNTGGGTQPPANPPPPPPPPPPPSPGQPDLIIVPGSLIAVPANPVTGNKVIFQAKIKNVGESATPNGVIHGLGFRINDKTVTWSDYSTNSLASGQTRTLTANGGPASGLSTWEAKAGSYELKVVLDNTNRIAESNETNNSFATTIKVEDSATPVDTSKPTVPGKPKPLVVSQTQISITWGASSDNKQVTHYKIFRNDALIATQATTSFTDSGLSPSTEYQYKVLAVDSSGNESAFTTVLSASTTAPPTQTTPTPNSDQPLTVTPKDQSEGIAIPGNDKPTLGGSIVLENPTAPYDAAATTLKLNDRVVKSSDGNTVEIDTSTLPNGDYVLTLETTGQDGSKSSTARTVTIDNDLNLYEKIRNSIFRSSAGTYSGARMNTILAGTAFAVIVLGGVVVYFVKFRGSSSRLKF